MRIPSWMLVAVLAASGAVRAADTPWPQELAVCEGQSDAVTWCGNGHLAVAVNARGHLAVLRWPGPGGPNQVAYTPVLPGQAGGLPRSGGAMWAIKTTGDASWIGWGPWTWEQPTLDDEGVVIQVRGRNEVSGLTAVQRVALAKDRPVALFQLEVSGAGEPPSCYWYADFSPCARQTPELAPVDALLTAKRDFACFSKDNGQTVFHFRPVSPGRKEWNRAAELADQTGKPTARGKGWEQFSDGAWMAYASVEPTTAFTCGNERSDSSAFQQVVGEVFGRSLANAPAAVGGCDSAIEIAPARKGDAFVATVMVACGGTREDASKTLQETTKLGFDRLVDDARGASFSGMNRLYPHLDEGSARLARRAATILLQSVDRTKGAVLENPAGGALSALDWPRDGAFVTLALDLIGERELAEAHTLFYCKAMRMEDRPGAPSGSIPAALYSDGKEALPRTVIDAGATAWVLGSIWRHAGFLDKEARRTYLEKTWDNVSRMADYLTSWTDARTHEPFPSFDRNEVRDRTTDANALETYMGVDAALRIAGELGRPIPESWSGRQRDLDIRLRFQCIDTQGTWKADAVLPFWQLELAQTELPSWTPVLERRLERLEADPAADVTETVSDAALAWQGMGDKLERLKPLLGRIARESRPSSAARAARTVIAVTGIYPVQ